MRVVGVYSFKRGMETLQQKRYAPMLKEIYEIIESIDAQAHKTKRSKEKTKGYRMLYNPKSLNDAFKRAFLSKGWESKKTLCEYPKRFYIADYNPPHPLRPAFREMDFVKNRVGVEVQFGKYAFMVYNVAAKMTIFHNLSRNYKQRCQLVFPILSNSSGTWNIGVLPILISLCLF